MQFSEQTDKKNPYWAVFSIIFKMMDTTNACVLPTRLVSCADFWAHEQDMGRRTCLFCCYVTYCVLYRIVTNVSGYVSYRGEMYRCRPRKDWRMSERFCFLRSPLSYWFPQELCLWLSFMNSSSILWMTRFQATQLGKDSGSIFRGMRWDKN